MSGSLTVRINDHQREGVDEGWIAQTVSGFRRDGKPVCIRVSIDNPEAKVGLTMGSCSGGVGGRPPNSAEARVIDAWRECVRTDDGSVEPGLAIRCIKRIERLVG
jgi:hypothetical protein